MKNSTSSLVKFITATILIVIVFGLVFMVFQAYRISSFRFSFSMPLRSGIQEIRTHLPAGRYCLVLNTNYDDRTFGVIPPQRQYTANVELEVIGTQGLILKSTNPHYEVFTVNKRGGDDLRVVANVNDLGKSDTLLFHLGHSF